jgi:TRAP-type C4-dicarboxylate transport system permease small subunit
MDSVPSWTEEVGSLFLIWLVASAAGILFLERKPIGIDFIFDRCSKRIQKLIIGLNVTLSIGFLIMLGTGSYLLAEKSVNVRSPALNLSFSYTFSSLAIASIIIILSILLRLLSSYYSNSNVDEMGNVK